MDKKNQKSVSESPGDSTPKNFTIGQVREMVKKDAHTALLLLDAIYRDQPTLEAISDYLHGRYMNAKHQAELKNQTKLEV